LRRNLPSEIILKMCIRSGIFQGVQGIVVGLRRSCKVIIELAAIRQCFSIEMALKDIEVLHTLDNGRVFSRDCETTAALA
jgi:hypothetical protein